jgi:hypothetical protein
MNRLPTRPSPALNNAEDVLALGKGMGRSGVRGFMDSKAIF